MIEAREKVALKLPASAAAVKPLREISTRKRQRPSAPPLATATAAFTSLLTTHHARRLFRALS